MYMPKIRKSENYILRLEKCDASRLKILLDDEVSQTITYYDPQDFKILSEVSSGASALVYNVCREDTTMFAIKKFRSSSKEAAIVNEIFLTGMASPYPSIIQFYGLTKLQDETNYSLVLEYAEGGTLKQYLRDNAVSFGWKNQLRFAKEIASAISWLHNVVGIIHADLHPDNILISKGTNHKFVALYEKCWQHEPHERPEVSHVISELNNIVSDNFSPKDNIASTTFTPKKGEANEDLYLSD
ncbi:unnamed protein product [Rhizophagus irregularis]|nr:unnamed protein product [Rhizophagus irregularis]